MSTRSKSKSREEEEQEQEQQEQEFINKKEMFQLVYDKTNQFANSKIVCECLKIFIIYLIWVTIHIVSANLYVYFCAHLSFVGFMLSPFQAILPHCKALGWLLQESILSIDKLMIAFGIWVAAKIKSYIRE